MTRRTHTGFSMYRPIATNDTPAGRKKNGRIELVLIRNHPAAGAATGG